jgi:hypothetical protein
MKEPSRAELEAQLKAVTLAAHAARRDEDPAREYNAKLQADHLIRVEFLALGLKVENVKLVCGLLELDAPDTPAAELPSTQEARASVLQSKVASDQRIHARGEREAAEREYASRRRRAYVAIRRTRGRATCRTARTGTRARGAGTPRARRATASSGSSSSSDAGGDTGPGDGEPHPVVILRRSTRLQIEALTRIGVLR